MIRRSLPAAALSVLGSASALAGTITINFETLPNGNPLGVPVALTSEYSAWGVVFDPKTLAHRHTTPSDATSPPNSLDHGNADTDSVTLDARFVLPGNPGVMALTPWVEISQDFGAASGNNVFIAYDLFGNEVDRATFNSSGATFRLESAPGIYRVFASGNDDLDNLRFETPIAASVVPLPASWVLGLLGLGVAVAGRARRAALV